VAGASGSVAAFAQHLQPPEIFAVYDPAAEESAHRVFTHFNDP
jgi:hypothetical protein